MYAFFFSTERQLTHTFGQRGPKSSTQSLDRGRGRIGFEDIAAPDFDASRYRTDLDTLMARIDAGEIRVAEIDELFCQNGYYEQTPPEDVRALEDERERLQGEVADLTSQWERTEEDLSGQRQ